MANATDDAPLGRHNTWQDVLLGGFLLGAAAFLVALFVALGGWRFGHGMHVTAVFSDATGLVVDAQVVVAGVPVGRVESLGVKGGKAVALLDVRRDADLRADAEATIRAKSLLGEKIVDVSAGSEAAPPLADGSTLVRTHWTPEPDQVLARLAPVLEQVDPQDLARLIRAGSLAFERLDLGRLERLADRLDRLAATGGPKLLALLDKVDALAPKAERLIGNLDAVATKAPAFLDRTDALLGRTQALVDTFDRDLATPSLRVLRRTDALLGRLPSSLDRLDRVADRLSVTLDQADPALDRLSSVLSDANIRRILREEGVRIHLGP